MIVNTLSDKSSHYNQTSMCYVLKQKYENYESFLQESDK
jgi:hypothetical protein